MRDYDVIVIGGGTAGLTIGIGGAQLGLKVAMVERNRVGGDCTWTGCVPSKALLHVASIAAAARQAAAWVRGTVAPPDFDFEQVKHYLSKAREQIAQYETPAYLQREHGLTVLAGEAELKHNATVQIGDRRFSARHIVVCTGSAPDVPAIAGLDDTRYLTSDTVFDALDALPRRLAVVGGGVIGCELAQAFGRLGSEVTILETEPRLLPSEDAELSATLQRSLQRDGVTVLSDTRIVRSTPAAAGSRAAILTLDGRPALEADAVVIATGRRPRTDRLGLVEAGVQVDPAGIAVDEYLRTSVPGIWAAGDVAGPYRFTHVAEMQARVILRNILFPWWMQKVDYRTIPWAIFTDPEIGRVGLSGGKARQQYGTAAQVTTVPMTRVDRAVTEGQTEGFIEFVHRRGRLLGAQIVGPRAGEMVQHVALAMHHRLPVSALSMVTVYPSMAYGLHQAADRYRFEQYRRSRIAPRLIGLLRRMALRYGAGGGEAFFRRSASAIR